MGACGVSVNHSFSLTHRFSIVSDGVMEKQQAIAAIRERANGVRVPIYKLCESVKVSPATFTRWKTNPESARWSVIGRLEKELNRLEAEA